MHLAIEVRKHPYLDDLYLSEQGYPYHECGHLYDTHIAAEYLAISYNGKSHHIHRLVAESWHENPNNYEIVNHIDGDKLNNAPSNIEWATHTDNLEHAYATGLRTDNNITYVRDIRSGKVLEFISQAKAAQFLSVNPSIVCAYLKSDMRAPFRRYFEIRFDCSWKFTIKDAENYRKSDRKRVVVVEEDGRVLIYPSVQAFQIARLPDRSYHVVYKWIERKRIKEKYGIDACLEYQYTGEFDNAFYVVDNSRDNCVIPDRVPRRVAVSCTVNGVLTTTTYVSLRQFCVKHGFKDTAVFRAVWKKGWYRNFKITYLG